MGLKVVEKPHDPAPTQRRPSWWRRVRWEVSWRWNRYVGRFIPRLVWPGDEVDVAVRFSTAPLGSSAAEVFEAQKQLNEMGIRFDTGSGRDGREWEWDFSLSGPISVTFKRRAKNPERRQERPRPTLTVDNSPAA